MNPLKETYVVPTGLALAITVLGAVMIGYGWWQANRNLKIALGYWLAMCVAGAALLLYGMNVLMDNAEAVTNIPQQAVVEPKD